MQIPRFRTRLRKDYDSLLDMYDRALDELNRSQIVKDYALERVKKLEFEWGSALQEIAKGRAKFHESISAEDIVATFASIAHAAYSAACEHGIIVGDFCMECKSYIDDDIDRIDWEDYLRGVEG